MIFHLAVNRVRTIVKPQSPVAFSPLVARPNVCPCNSSCRRKCLYVFYCAARHVRTYIPGVPFVSAFIARLNGCLVVGHERGYSSDCTSLLDDVTCERNASPAGDLEGLCRPEKDLLGGYVAQRRSIRRLCRLERILRVLPPGNSLLSPGSEKVRKAQEVNSGFRTMFLL